MSVITIGVALAASAGMAATTLVRRRKGLFARFMEARQRQALQELTRHGLRLAAGAGRGRLEDQRAQRGFAAVRALSASRLAVTGMCVVS